MRRWSMILLAAALVASGSTAAWAGPNDADATTVADTRPVYQPQRTCSPAAKPGTAALLNLLVQRWGGASWGISRGCEVGGQSEHKEGRALDWHMDAADPGDRQRVAEAVQWLTADNGAVAAQLGVMYIIWDQKVWAAYRPAEGWRPMADRGSYTANHHDHVHISLTWDGAMQQTAWWTGVPVTSPLTGPCGVGGAPACRPPTGQALATILPDARLDPIPPESLPEPGPEPLVGGTAQVGHLLQVVPGTWVPEGSTLAYQWIRDGIPIPGADQASYAVEPYDVDTTVLVRVMAFAPDGTVVQRLSADLPAVTPAPFRAAPSPTVLGEPAVGRTLSVDPGLWRPFPATLAFQWRRDGRPIPGATGYSYHPTAADLGRRISVTLTATATGFNPVTTTSRASAPVRRAALTAPVPLVEGRRAEGQTLTALTGTWQPGRVELRYQWLRDGRAIRGATGARYKLTEADVGAVVRVRVQGSRPGYGTVTVTSVGDEAVRRGPSRPAPTPTTSPSATPTPTTSPSASPSPSPSTSSSAPTPSATTSPSGTPSPSPSPKPAATPKPSPSPKPAASPSPSPTRSAARQAAAPNPSASTAAGTASPTPDAAGEPTAVRTGA